MRKFLNKSASGLASFTECAAALLILALVLINLAQVVSRYVIDLPLFWSEELMRYALVWLVFLGAVAALWRGEHMVIEILEAFCPPWIQRVVRCINIVLMGCVCFIFVYFGGPLALRSMDETSPSAGIPMVYPMLAVSVGGALMMYLLIVMLINTLHKKQTDERG